MNSAAPLRATAFTQALLAHGRLSPNNSSAQKIAGAGGAAGLGTERMSMAAVALVRRAASRSMRRRKEEHLVPVVASSQNHRRGGGGLREGAGSTDDSSELSLVAKRKTMSEHPPKMSRAWSKAGAALQALKAAMSRTRREAHVSGELAAEVVGRALTHANLVAELVNTYALHGMALSPNDLERLRPHLVSTSETLGELGQALEVSATNVEELNVRLRAANDDFVVMQKESIHLRRDLLEQNGIIKSKDVEINKLQSKALRLTEAVDAATTKTLELQSVSEALDQLERPGSSSGGSGGGGSGGDGGGSAARPGQAPEPLTERLARIVSELRREREDPAVDQEAEDALAKATKKRPPSRGNKRRAQPVRRSASPLPSHARRRPSRQRSSVSRKSQSERPSTAGSPAATPAPASAAAAVVVPEPQPDSEGEEGNLDTGAPAEGDVPPPLSEADRKLALLEALLAGTAAPSMRSSETSAAEENTATRPVDEAAISRSPPRPQTAARRAGRRQQAGAAARKQRASSPVTSEQQAAAAEAATADTLVGEAAPPEQDGGNLKSNTEVAAPDTVAALDLPDRSSADVGNEVSYLGGGGMSALAARDDDDTDSSTSSSSKTSGSYNGTAAAQFRESSGNIPAAAAVAATGLAAGPPLWLPRETRAGSGGSAGRRTPPRDYSKLGVTAPLRSGGELRGRSIVATVAMPVPARAAPATAWPKAGEASSLAAAAADTPGVEEPQMAGGTGLEAAPAATVGDSGKKLLVVEETSASAGFSSRLFLVALARETAGCRQLRQLHDSLRAVRDDVLRPTGGHVSYTNLVRHARALDTQGIPALRRVLQSFDKASRRWNDSAAALARRYGLAGGDADTAAVCPFCGVDGRRCSGAGDGSRAAAAAAAASGFAAGNAGGSKSAIAAAASNLATAAASAASRSATATGNGLSRNIASQAAAAAAAAAGPLRQISSAPATGERREILGSPIGWSWKESGGVDRHVWGGSGSGGVDSGSGGVDGSGGGAEIWRRKDTPPAGSGAENWRRNDTSPADAGVDIWWREDTPPADAGAQRRPHAAAAAAVALLPPVGFSFALDGPPR